MKMMLIAGLVITGPALVVAFLNFGSTIMIPALASLAVNSLPFLVAGWLMRGNDGEEDQAH